MTVNGFGDSFGGDENVLKLNCGSGTKTIELFILNE